VHAGVLEFHELAYLLSNALDICAYACCHYTALNQSALHLSDIRAIIDLFMLKVDILTNAAQLQSLKSDWIDLVDRSPEATVFQSFEWNYAWWKSYGADRAGFELRIVTVWDEASRLVGVAPLALCGWLLGIRALTFLGVGVSDYLDFICDPSSEPEICAAVYSKIAEIEGWRIVDLHQLRYGAVALRHRPAANTSLAFLDYPLEQCPYLEYPAGGASDERWQALTKRYGKKFRAHIGYYERKLKSIYDVRIGYIDKPEMLDDAMRDLFELHRRRWNKRWMPGVLGGDRVQEFHLEIARSFLERGWLRLHYIQLDGQYQAVLYCFAKHSRTCYYQGGFEPTLAKLSLGSTLTANAIRCSIAEGRDQFDFLRGNEPYKDRWTLGAYRENTRRLIGRSGSVWLSIASRLHLAEMAIQTKLKDAMHHAFSKESKKQTNSKQTGGGDD
jgi:CelD/BcsL family acetyltransferase involved in cellulose biosynthesis